MRTRTCLSYFSQTREQPEHWVQGLNDQLLRPLAVDTRNERERTLAHKLDSITKACSRYLSVALQAAEQRAESDQRNGYGSLRAAMDESVKEPVIRDELSLASQRLIGLSRPTFEKATLENLVEIDRRLLNAIAVDAAAWAGNLARQTAKYQAWIFERLVVELEPVSHTHGPTRV